MIRRTALKILLSLSAMSYLMVYNPQKSYAGSGGSSGNDSSSGGGSSGNDSSSGGGSSSNDSSSRGGSSGNSGSSSSDSSNGGSTPSRPSGPDDFLSGSSATDTDSQDELLRRLNASLQDDGLETVTPDNLQSTLDAFK